MPMLSAVGPQIVKTARSVLFRKAFLDKALQITMRCRSSRLCPSSDFAQRKLGFSIGQNPEKARGNGNRLYCTRAFFTRGVALIGQVVLVQMLCLLRGNSKTMFSDKPLESHALCIANAMGEPRGFWTD
ncbi:hypothetical protein Q644_02640 [Brucella intermedia 229E]|uniref:Uncharacterized protein n=1 Tax=Brucella intermedia 229E TaxID=1337887 RepID=U4V7I1_9HYPH|nr:hypothetical protein Q644_02640 [Brucella intermedia 229E]